MRIAGHFQLLLVCSVVLFSGLPEVRGKRFDCRLFCRETGFHGMLGGCRCSFTLFTAKRAPKDSVPRENVARFLSHLVPEYQNMVVGNPPLRLPSNFPSASGMEEAKFGTFGPSRQDFINPSQKPNEFQANEIGLREAENSYKKRREIEMDLDNGGATDYLRLPY